jgi:hypothetical protein
VNCIVRVEEIMWSTSFTRRPKSHCPSSTAGTLTLCIVKEIEVVQFVKKVNCEREEIMCAVGEESCTCIRIVSLEFSTKNSVKRSYEKQSTKWR